MPAFPLDWPDALPRWTKPRESGSFKTTLVGALDNVETSLKAFGRDSSRPITDIVLSSNVSLGVQKPADPGVAVWFIWDGGPHCIAVDRYATPAANLQAIFHVLEARRTELRHGTLALVQASMKGFLALPPPGPHWSEILGVTRTATSAQIEQAYRRLSVEQHPDKPGGSEAAMAELNVARDRALKERNNA